MNSTTKPEKRKFPSKVGPNPKQKRLDARIRDWETVQSKSGFHKPGSYNK